MIEDLDLLQFAACDIDSKEKLVVKWCKVPQFEKDDEEIRALRVRAVVHCIINELDHSLKYGLLGYAASVGIELVLEFINLISESKEDMEHDYNTFKEKIWQRILNHANSMKFTVRDAQILHEYFLNDMLRDYYALKNLFRKPEVVKEEVVVETIVETEPLLN